MAKLIALDDGHGMETLGKETPFIPELGRKIKENEFNRAVVSKLGEELIRCGFDILFVAEGDADIPLKIRTDLANNKIKNKFNRMADAYVSVHFDALDGSFEGKDASGHTVFHYPNTVNGKKLASCIDKYLDGGTQQTDRNVKSADFHVLRESKMVAVLSENGFMDNKREAMLMLNTNFIKEVAIEHAKGICEYFGVSYIPYVEVITPTLTYKAHVQNKGWQPVVSGNKVAGTEGQSLRMEALIVNLDGIKVQAHVQSIGWQKPVSSGQVAGTEGKSLRMEAVKMWLTGELAKTHDIFYRVHVQSKGWLEWVKNDTNYAGTVGKSLRMEAIQIKLVRK